MCAFTSLQVLTVDKVYVSPSGYIGMKKKLKMMEGQGVCVCTTYIKFEEVLLLL